MTVEEKAQAFALKKLEGQIESLKRAYIEGYNDALKEHLHLPVVEEGIEYLDMSLPSGTMWSQIIRNDDEFLTEKSVPYNDVKDLEIPTIEDIEELKANTHHYGYSKYVAYTSKNGEKLCIDQKVQFWVKTNDEESNEVYCCTSGLNIERVFRGLSKNFLLVKRPK